MKWSIFFVNIFIHVAVMALFLTIFFFTIALYFERKILESQVDFIIDDVVGNTFKPLSASDKKKVQIEILSLFDNKDFSKEDKQVKDSNDKISKKAWTFVGILTGIILVVVVILGFIFKWNFFYLKYLFNSALYSLIFVAITETLFMFLVAQNFLSADPNKIKLKVVETLIKNRCGPKGPKQNVKKCLGNNP